MARRHKDFWTPEELEKEFSLTPGQSMAVILFKPATYPNAVDGKEGRRYHKDGFLDHVENMELRLGVCIGNRERKVRLKESRDSEMAADGRMSLSELCERYSLTEPQVRQVMQSGRMDGRFWDGRHYYIVAEFQGLLLRFERNIGCRLPRIEPRRDA